jgi:hypothetical protein
VPARAARQPSFWPSEAFQSAMTNWPMAVAARMMGSEASTALAGTIPTSTRPSAIDPAMKPGSPIRAGQKWPAHRSAAFAGRFRSQGQVMTGRPSGKGFPPVATLSEPAKT